MKTQTLDATILSEVFRIVEGSLRLDAQKVRNYTELLANKLSEMGQTAPAARLQKMIAQQGQELRPTRSSTAGIPVDQESRFPLLERVETNSGSAEFCFTEDQKQLVEEFCSSIENHHLFEAEGIASSCSLLLHGPPGCGKSHLAGTIASRLGLPLLVARLDGLISSFLGSTAKNIRAVFQHASQMPCVLFLDEFDAIAKLRDDQHELGELKRVVNSFLQAFDLYANQVNVIAATNHEQLLDPAVWRRFRFQLHLGLPSEEQRLQLWATFLRTSPLSERESRALASLSEGVSGAEIQNTVLRLKQRAITHDAPITSRDAIILLSSVSKADVPRQFAEELHKGRDSVAKWLAMRDADVFNQTVVADLLGVSKSTISRQMTPNKRQRAKHHER